MRVGLVIAQLTSGGAEGQLLQLCRGLIAHARAEPTVYCLSERIEPYGPMIEAAGCMLRVIGGGRLQRVRKLRRQLTADRVELVHSWLFIANAYAWVANRGTDRPLLTSARNCKRQGAVLSLLNRRAFAASDAIIVNSKQVARYVAREYGASESRMAVVHNAIDTERFRPATQAPGRGLCVMMVARLARQKNPFLFLSAAAALRRQMPAETNIRFVLIGDGPLRRRVEAEVDAGGLRDCCTLTGECRDVADRLREADLFWLTSDWEGSPNVVLEAMASGVPVVVTDVGGAREIVRHGQEGFLIRAGDCSALVAHTVDLLMDGEKRARFARAARVRAEEFGPQRMVTAMQDVYAGVLQGRRT